MTEIIVDGKTFLLSKEEIACFGFIQNMISDLEPNEPIKIDVLNSDIFQVLLDYVKQKFKPTNTNWKKDYFDNNRIILATLLQCSQFLDIVDLTEELQKEIARQIKLCTDANQMKRKLNIQNNMTEEKRKEVREKLSWTQI